MDEHTLDKISHQMVLVLTTIWGIFLIPIVIMIILISQGYATIPGDSILLTSILYYNLLSYPVVLALSSTFSWMSLKNKQYRLAMVLALLPFINILLEFIAADLALYFS